MKLCPCGSHVVIFTIKRFEKNLHRDLRASISITNNNEKNDFLPVQDQSKSNKRA